jgi:hypothetical protein
MKKKDNSSPGRKGRGKTAPSRKARITIRLDSGILEWFRRRAEAAGGGNYQTMINEALRQYVDAKGELLEKSLRHIFREEIERLNVLTERMPRSSGKSSEASVGFRRKSPTRRPK